VTDHKTVIRAALAQLPGGHRRGKKVLIRIDGAGGTHELLAWLTRRRLSYSIGFSLPGDLDSIQKKLATVPPRAWTPAYDADGQVRPGAWVAELTGLFDLSGWPAGMWLIVRKERPHPGAQLRITDVDGHRITAFVTNTTRGQLADLELRHRRRARAEDRIRAAKDTGLTNLPLHDFAYNQIWCALVALALRADRLDAVPRPDRPRRAPLGAQATAAAAAFDPGPPRPHRPPPAAAPGRHRAVHRARAASPGRPRPAGRATRIGPRAGLTRRSTDPTTSGLTGPWNRRPPSDLGRSVTPTCHSHTHAGGARRRPPR